MSQSSVDDAHSELRVEICKRSDPSHEKVDVILLSVVCQKALHGDNFDLVIELGSDFLKESSAMLY